MNTSSKTTFDAKHENINGQPHSTWTVRRDGEVIGWIEKEADDFGNGFEQEWKVVEYDAQPAEGTNRYFACKDYGSARAALAAAKAWMRGLENVSTRESEEDPQGIAE